jgi:transglutaminase-like putative cysteine protease
VKGFLESTDVIDWRHQDVLARAQILRQGPSDPVETARRSFEWVRDEIKHSADYCLTPVTCSASEVLRHGSGYCYAKSHLLAALLRANGLPAGLCYQRLSLNGGGAPYCLHGLNAVWLPAVGWYRIDPRGNRGDINAQFTPPVEQLAFSPNAAGEADLLEIWADPLPAVVNALRAHVTTDTLSRNLPDLEILTRIRAR